MLASLRDAFILGAVVHRFVHWLHGSCPMLVIMFVLIDKFAILVHNHDHLPLYLPGLFTPHHQLVLEHPA